MIRCFCLIAFVSSALCAQSNDSATLQAILQELRLLRQEIPATNLVAQRVQILLYRARVQEDVVSKARQHADQITAKLKDAERERSRTSASLKETEDKLAGTQEKAQREMFEEVIREFKHRLEMWGQEEERFRFAEVTATDDLKKEEAKLADLQQRLDKIERQLEAYGTDK